MPDYTDANTETDTEKALIHFSSVHNLTEITRQELSETEKRTVNEKLLSWARKLAGMSPPHAMTKSMRLYIADAQTTWKELGKSDEVNPFGNIVLNQTEWRDAVTSMHGPGLRIEVEIDWSHGPGRLPMRASGAPMDAQFGSQLLIAAKKLRLDLCWAMENNDGNRSDVRHLSFVPIEAEAKSPLGRSNLFRVTWEIKGLYSWFDFPKVDSACAVSKMDFADSTGGVIFSVIGASPAEPGRQTAGMPGVRNFTGQPASSLFPVVINFGENSYYRLAYLTGVEWLGVGWDQI